MKTNLLKISMMLLAVFALSLTSCKKDKDTDPADPSSLQQLSRDEEFVEAATDETMNDVEMVMSQGDLKSTTMLPCNATVDSVVVANDTMVIYITYNGNNCNNTRFRTGQVEIRKRVGTHWFMPGAAVIVKHINFAITRIATNKTIVLNGVKIHRNVTGGVIWQLGNGIESIVHRTRGHVTVTFEDSTFKTWNIARQRTYTGVPPQNLVITTDGFGEAGNLNNLTVWGLNRQGERFYTQIIQPVVVRQFCDWDPVAGIKKHAIPDDSKSATLTFGYNSQNQPVTGNECPTKYKLDWVRHNQSGTVYLWL